MAKVKGTVQLLVNAGQAAPSPALGQGLGPLGVPMQEFCKQFNARTTTLEPGVPIPVKLIAYTDRSFKFDTQTPPTAWFLKRLTGIERGSAKPNKEFNGKVSVKQIYEVAKIKQTDPKLKDVPLPSICRSIIGTAKSMGIRVLYSGDAEEQRTV